MSIFRYVDYRLFLRSHFSQLPKKGRGKLLELSKHLRVHPTAVSQIFSGLKNFSDDQALEVCEFLDLLPVESRYFRLLVRIENANTQKLKKALLGELTDLRNEAKSAATRISYSRELTDTERAIFYSSWLFSAVRLYCGTSSSGKTAEEVVARFQISRKKGLKIIEFLVNSQLLIMENEKYKQGPQSTFVDRDSPFLVKHLANWRVRALQTVDQLSDDDLMYSGPFSISPEDFEHLRERLLKVIQEFTGVVKNSGSEELACLNVDLFHF